MNKNADETSQGTDGLDRRGPNRTREDADWESKVLARVGGHLRKLPKDVADQPGLGWESTVLDTLRRRIERESK